MAEPGKYPLLKFPRVVFDCLEHVAAVIRFDHDRRAAAQSFRNQGGDVAKVHQRGNFHSLMSRRKAEIVDSVVRNSKGVKIDFADTKVFT